MDFQNLNYRAAQKLKAWGQIKTPCPKDSEEMGVADSWVSKDHSMGKTEEREVAFWMCCSLQSQDNQGQDTDLMKVVVYRK